jgi:hypothetical protein
MLLRGTARRRSVLLLYDLPNTTRGRHLAQQPTYPTDAKVGDDAISKPNSNEPLNETLSHAVTAKQAKERSAEKEEDGSGRNRRLIKGAAIGVGSAALVAALIYARRSYYSSGKDED